MSTMTPEMESLKTQLKATWMSGDYGHFAKYLEPPALDFLRRLHVQPGTRMLDVACGAGQIAIPAAKTGVRVTGVDIASNLIDQARARAKAEGVEASFEEGDAEMLPYGDAQFDLVVSLIGAMFAPRADRVAAELLRVCRPGGRIVMANWTPGGHVGQMFKIIGKYAPPSPLMDSPLKWGDEAVVQTRFQSGAARIVATKRFYAMRYPFPPADVVEFFNEYYGPTLRAMASLEAQAQENLKRELVELWASNNLSAEAASTSVDAELLEVVVERA